MKILLAVDGSPGSDAAIEEVARRPWPLGSEIKVLTAFELPLPPTPETWAIPPDYFEELNRVVSEQARLIVERAVKKLKSAMGDETNVKSEFVQGPPRTMILDEAERWGADLIVVGSHGYRAWERFLLGSVSQSVVSHAKCSVEVVRCPDAAREATCEPVIEKGQEEYLPKTMLSRRVNFIEVEVTRIDSAERSVTIAHGEVAGELRYDDLIFALGCRLATEGITGFFENTHHLLNPDKARKFGKPVAAFHGGRAAIGDESYLQRSSGRFCIPSAFKPRAQNARMLCLSWKRKDREGGKNHERQPENSYN